jgi:hypothetical protein
MLLTKFYHIIYIFFVFLFILVNPSNSFSESFDISNWINLKKIPDKISIDDVSKPTVIIADYIEFDGQDYLYYPDKQIILIADTIKISGPVRFRAKLTIMTRKLEIGLGGLIIMQNSSVPEMSIQSIDINEQKRAQITKYLLERKSKAIQPDNIEKEALDTMKNPEKILKWFIVSPIINPPYELKGLYSFVGAAFREERTIQSGINIDHYREEIRRLEKLIDSCVPFELLVWEEPWGGKEEEIQDGKKVPKLSSRPQICMAEGSRHWEKVPPWDDDALGHRKKEEKRQPWERNRTTFMTAKEFYSIKKRIKSIEDEIAESKKMGKIAKYEKVYEDFTPIQLVDGQDFPQDLKIAHNIEELFSFNVLTNRAASEWLIRMMEHLQTSIINSARRNKLREIFDMFHKYHSLPVFRIVPELNSAYAQAATNLYALRGALVLSLRSRSIMVQELGSIPQPVTVFAEKDSVKNYIAPTTALVNQNTVAGKQSLGLIKFDPLYPEQITLHFTVQLTVDPWLAQLASRELQRSDEEYIGMFTNWDLTARPIQAEGVKSSQIDVVGNQLWCRLILDSNRSSLAFFQLTKGIGLPLIFDWVYRGDKNLKSELGGIRLSLARRSKPELTVGTDGKLTNNERTRITVEYVQVANDIFLALTPALTIQAGETASLPLPKGTNLSQVSIPAEAVVYSGMDPEHYQDDFYTLDSNETVEWKTLTNLLPSTFMLPGTFQEERLLYIETSLIYAIGEGPHTKEVVIGPINLSPSPAVGSEIKLGLVKSTESNVKVRVSGKAFYTNGTRLTLTETITDDLAIKITDVMIPKNHR